MNERLKDWMNEWTNELNDGKYKSTCNNVISDMVLIALKNYDMTKDMIEEWIHRWINRIINEWIKLMN